MTPELCQAIEQAVWYPYNVLPKRDGEMVHAWIVRAVMATLEPTLAELDAARPVVAAARAWWAAADGVLESVCAIKHGTQDEVAEVASAHVAEVGRLLDALGAAVHAAEHDGQVPA